ncbi:polyprenyl synthetase family protein [Streptomyces sulfonofaciens]|uniref:polyprenyl synthetase family protein n=1 Tax=Streptomyces sulfonofaciens TaxID=68272 RepID=UPI001E44D514|nr:polyprenyl synthetase family protein [Streptomyces sulfonofaciens]
MGPAPVPDPARIDADVTAAVGQVLDALLSDRLAEAARVDALFRQDVAGRIADFTLHGGRRRRSQFLWWGFRACGGGADPLRVAACLRIGACLELIQTCALVHDDVMDGSRRRRGRPAVHASFDSAYVAAPPAPTGVPFGVSAAILAGDLALVWADDSFALTPLPGGAARAVGRLWRAMRTEMVAGQYLDVHAQAVASRSSSRAMRAAYLKTALYSAERPLALGAALADAGHARTRALRSAGRCAGLAFQLRDDLAGIFGAEEDTGKAAGEDVRAGKASYPLAVARLRARSQDDHRALAVLDDCIGAGGGLTADGLARVRDVLTTTGTRAAVERRIARLVAQGLRHVARAEPAPGTELRLRALMREAAGVPSAGSEGPPAQAAAPGGGGAAAGRAGQRTGGTHS